MSPYTEDFYRSLRDGTQSSAREIIPLLLELTHPCSVVDVGCGTGTWLSVFREHGIENILGIDGDWINRETLEIPAQHYHAIEIRQPFRLERTFDLVLSLEVAEHLPEACASDFIGSLTSLGDVVVFSAAIPYQGGYHHVNEQWPDYWAGLFAHQGFVAVDLIRQRIWQNEHVYWWYAQNMLMFIRRDALVDPRHQQLAQQVESGAPRSLVHPKKYLALIEYLHGR